MEEKEKYAILSFRLAESLNHTLFELSRSSQPSVCSHFKLPVSQPPTKALKLLRDAEKAGLVFQINTGPKYETYALGVSRTVQAFNVDPQWWVGLSIAEIRAGISATPAEINEAQQEIDKKAKKKGVQSKTKRMEAARMDAKLAEGLRRQTLGLPMDGKLKASKQANNAGSAEIRAT